MLGRKFDVNTVSHPEAIISDGPYGSIRHPATTSTLLLYAGLCSSL